jgi:hypothetical protein
VRRPRPLDALADEERRLFSACLASPDNAAAIEAWSQRRAARTQPSSSDRMPSPSA